MPWWLFGSICRRCDLKKESEIIQHQDTSSLICNLETFKKEWYSGEIVALPMRHTNAHYLSHESD